jgi:uncharacterized phiE125 gp8 family phage protein
MPQIAVTPPSGECLHFDEVRNIRRIDDHADDAMLKSMISAARQSVETKTRQQLLHARWMVVLDSFPAFGCASVAPYGKAVSIPSFAIRLPHSPLVKVESIQYLDMAGIWQTIPSSDYVVNYGMAPAIITPTFGKVWPIPLPQVGSVKVTYTAGYASPVLLGGTLAANQFRVAGSVSWAVGDRVQFYNSGGVLPAPLDAECSYLIATAANGVYTLSDEAGAAITFDHSGTGRSFIGVVPEAIRSWMLLRIGALYENREELAVGSRIVVLELPFVDGLLDPFMDGVY